MGSPPQKKKKHPQIMYYNYMHKWTLMVPSFTGINLEYIGTLPSVFSPLSGICWLKTPFLQASSLPPRPLPPANGSSHPNWLKHHQRCVASPQPSEDFCWGKKKKNMPKNISSCLNPMHFLVGPLFFGEWSIYFKHFQTMFFTGCDPFPSSSLTNPLICLNCLHPGS